jgi:hypothetical protein
MLHVSLLGEQAITDDEIGVRTRSSRTVALVAFLVVHAGSPQPRQRIAGLFWPDSTEMQALTNLRRELHHLRQVLGREPSLVVTLDGLAAAGLDGAATAGFTPGSGQATLTYPRPAWTTTYPRIWAWPESSIRSLGHGPAR